MKKIAYSPIYKYGVGYNKTSGQFTFTRGAGSDINTFNPAVLASPVAAQMGGYMGDVRQLFQCVLSHGYEYVKTC